MTDLIQKARSLPDIATGEQWKEMAQTFAKALLAADEVIKTAALLATVRDLQQRLSTPPTEDAREYMDAAEDVVTRAMIAYPFLACAKTTEKLADGLLTAVRRYEVIAAQIMEAPSLAAAFQSFRDAGPREWQPIETAPKDGTQILVCGPYSMDIAIVRDLIGDGRTWSCVSDGHAVIESQSDFGTYYRTFDNPTHWMPLPPPPVTAKMEKK